MSLKFPRGTILLFKDVRDHNGVNAKDRFVVLVRDYDDEDELAFGIAITGTFGLPLPSTSNRLQWHQEGRCRTRLRKECVADCTWIVMRSEKDFKPNGGHVPPTQLLAILEQVEHYLLESEKRTEDPDSPGNF